MKFKSIVFNGKYILIVFSIMSVIFVLKPYIVQLVLTDNITITTEEPTDEDSSLKSGASSELNLNSKDSVIEYYPIVDKVYEEIEGLPYYFGIHTLKGYSKVRVTEEVYNSYEIGSPIGVINKSGEYVFSGTAEMMN